MFYARERTAPHNRRRDFREHPTAYVNRSGDDLVAWEVRAILPGCADGPSMNHMRFKEGRPTLAVKVRSENDYENAAERDTADKRADYFRAGTLVIWEVDPDAETVAAYRDDEPAKTIIAMRGDLADAEQAVPGWRIAVAEMFDG